MLFYEQASARMLAARAAMPGFSKHPLQRVSQSQPGVDCWKFPLSQPHPGHQGLHQSQHQQQQHLQHQHGQYGQPRQPNNQQAAQQDPYQNHQQQQSLQRLRPGQDDARSAELDYIGAVDSQMGRFPASLAPGPSQDRGPQTQRQYQRNDRLPAAAASTAVAGAAAAAATSQGAFASVAASQPVRTSTHLLHPSLGRSKFLRLRRHASAFFISFGLNRV